MLDHHNNNNAFINLNRLSSYFSIQACSVYLVGGCLRDSLLNRPIHDFDLATSESPHRFGPELAKDLGATYVNLNSQPDIGRIIVKPIIDLEESALNNDGSTTALTIDLSEFSGEITDNLTTRDFTVDSMALNILDCQNLAWRDFILDPLNGLQDLFSKKIRATSYSIFIADPGRLLRAVRLAAQLGFVIEPDTAMNIKTHAALITRVSGERIRDEFLNILSGDGAKAQLDVLDRLGILCQIIPELAMTKGVTQPKAHYWNVWEHLLHTVETAELITKGHQNSPIYSLAPWTPESEAYFGQIVSDGHTRRTILKLTALLHDIAKPQTKTTDDSGRTRFLGHSELGAAMAIARLTELRLSSNGISMVSKMIEAHLRPSSMRQGTEYPTKRAVFRYFRSLGDLAIDTIYLALADYLAAKGPHLMPDQWAEHARIMSHILELGTQQITTSAIEKLVTGRDLMENLNIESGPMIGYLLNIIEEARAAGEISNKEQALALALKVK